MWLLVVDHARLAGLAAAACATFIAAVTVYSHGAGPATTLLRAAVVFVLTYGACLGFLVVYQRATVYALAREYRAVKAARKAALAAARAQAQAEARGDDATESLTPQEA